MIQKIAGKKQSTPLKHLSVTNHKITGKKAIADLLTKRFSKNSSSQFNTEFYKTKTILKKKNISFSSNNSEEYNKLFTLTELVDSIKKSNHSAVGPDEIHNEFLKLLPDESVKCLLKIYNNIWVNDTFLETWRQSIIVPIPKSGKDTSNLQNYRPIALTSCLCNMMEWMINSRLTWYFETKGLVTNMQTVIRKRRGTIDHLIQLETFIRKQHLTAVFFDLEKPYDTTWKYGIMWDLHDLGLRGRLPMFIKNFLFERTFRVRMESTFSDLQYQEEGVPQGSILSVTLFSIKINYIVKYLTPSINCALYIDDFVICYQATHIDIVEWQLQLNLNINKWARENGFKFSKSKTKCMPFSSLRKMHNDPVLKIDDSEIPVVNEDKFLRVIFDKKLSFIPRIKYLKNKSTCAQQLLQVVAHTEWGADCQTLIKLYRTLLHSQLDYGIFVYRSARKSYMKQLHPIHHESLRLVLGAFRTFPIDSLYAEAHEAPLLIRSEKLALQYYTKLKSSPSNPAYDCTFDPKYRQYFDQKEKSIRPFGLHRSLFSKNPPSF